MKNLIVIISVVLFACSCGESTSTPEKAETPKVVSPGEKLAVLDNIFDSTDIKAIRIKVLLKELADTYAEPQDSIAEYSYRAQSVLHDKGIDETCLGVLEAMHKVQKLDNTPYKDAVVVYLMIRSNQ